MFVRRATPRDRQHLPALHTAAVQAFGPDSYDDPAVRQWAKAGERSPSDYTVPDADYFVVAVRHGDVAGFGHFAAEQSAVHAVYVHPDHARRGVGSLLLGALEGFARGRGCRSVSLTASLNAVAFYEQAGYRQLETTDSEGLTVVEMEKQFAAADTDGQSSSNIPVDM